MIRTDVRATAKGRPEWSIFTIQARVIPEYLTVTAGPLTARNFFVLSKQRMAVWREERFVSFGTLIAAQVKAGNRPGFYSAHHRP